MTRPARKREAPETALPARSGTTWADSDYTAAGYAPRMTLRLRKVTRERLAELAASAGWSQTDMIGALIEAEHARWKRRTGAGPRNRPRPRK